jgi:tRNA pseudouridine55 synthase
MKGFLLIDKEKGQTSFDVVRAVRRAFGIKKVGHAGTLDPLATGLLVVALGEGTKLLEYMIGCDKEYEVVGRFGARSDSYDADGVIEEVVAATELMGKKVDQERIQNLINDKYMGLIDQLPPKYSALKIGGKRACDLVREGKEVEMKLRQVQIDSFKLVEDDWPRLRFRVQCGSGTYIRSLINDLGADLEVGAYVEELRRTRVGEFRIEEAVSFDALESSKLLSLEYVVKKYFEVRDLDDFAMQSLKDGKTWVGERAEGKLIAAFYKGVLVGLLKNSPDGRGVKFGKVVLN